MATQPDREAMDGKDVQRLERDGVITAQQVLMAHQVGQAGCQRVAYSVGPQSEESPSMLPAPPVIVVFDSEHAVLERAAVLARIDVGIPAARTVAPASTGRSCQPQLDAAGFAGSERVAVGGLGESTACRADHNVLRVSPARCERISGKLINHLMAVPESVVGALAVMNSLDDFKSLAIERIATELLCIEVVGGTCTIVHFVHSSIRDWPVPFIAHHHAGKAVPAALAIVNGSIGPQLVNSR